MSASQTAVEEPIVRSVPKQSKPKPKRQPRYNVILWDDPVHTYNYVIEMMQKLFHHSPIEAFKIATEVDKKGKAICYTTSKEVAELKRDQIHAFGADPHSRSPSGSMAASIEPAESA